MEARRTQRRTFSDTAELTLCLVEHRLSQIALVSPLLLRSTRTSSMTALGYCPSSSFSIDLSMSQAQSSPAFTPHRASISTPVVQCVRTLTVQRKAPSSRAQSTEHPSIGIGWQCGNIRGVSFTAWMTATLDASRTSPFGERPFATTSRLAAESRSTPLATASRATTGFEPTSMIPVQVSSNVAPPST